MRNARSKWRVLFGAALMSLAAACAVSESDIRRWETTEHGPEKLYAVLTHDKYAQALRAESALSLARMRPRGGQRIGLENLTRGLSSLRDDERQLIVNDIVPALVEQMKQPAPQKDANGVIPPDPSIPFKDAAFALISHEPPLVTDDEDKLKRRDNKSKLIAALTEWVQADFELRFGNPGQQYSLEQIMRHPSFGAPSVKSLPAIIKEESTKVDRISALVGELGDEDTKKRGAQALVDMAKRLDSQAWVDKQKPLVEDANKRAKLNVTPEQLTEQLKKFQDQELEKVFSSMKTLGGRPVVEYALTYAGDKNKAETMRTKALAVLENRIDKNHPKDIDHLLDIVKDDANPDKVRGIALQRMGELPKDIAVPKLYSLFDKKIAVRVSAASMVLKSITTKDLPEFMKHLPHDDTKKMSLSEPLNYGALINSMETGGGPKPHDAVQPYLQSKDLGPKLTALGTYYQGKKADRGALAPYENDAQAIPKCAPEDGCGWSCDVPKADNPKERESKAITTVGEFVKYCVVPSMEN
jgi:hypothetical protein